MMTGGTSLPVRLVEQDASLIEIGYQPVNAAVLGAFYKAIRWAAAVWKLSNFD